MVGPNGARGLMSSTGFGKTLPYLGGALLALSCSGTDANDLFDTGGRGGGSSVGGLGSAGPSGGIGSGGLAATGGSLSSAAGGNTATGGGDTAGSDAGGSDQGGADAGAAGAGGADTGGAGTAAGGSAGRATQGGTAGAAGKAAQGGSAGKATQQGGTAGGGGKSAQAGAAGKSQAGAGGASACATACAVNADCVATACVCRSGFIGNGQTCRRPISCAELHQAKPDLASGPYTLKPTQASTEFQSYCEMSAEGGGFTLVLNQGTTFDPTTPGAAALAYNAAGTNLAYSHVPLVGDVMLDMSDTPIVGATYTARVVITAVHTLTRGHTVRELFATGPHYLEQENNSNLLARISGGRTCNDALPGDIGQLVCNSCTGSGCTAAVLVFGDIDPGCDQTATFAIGGATSYTTAWGNCAGWPQNPNISANHYPDHFRVWVR